jgi:hypothetical protein
LKLVFNKESPGNNIVFKFRDLRPVDDQPFCEESVGASTLASMESTLPYSPPTHNASKESRSLGSKRSHTVGPVCSVGLWSCLFGVSVVLFIQCVWELYIITYVLCIVCTTVYTCRIVCTAYTMYRVCVVCTADTYVPCKVTWYSPAERIRRRRQ